MIDHNEVQFIQFTTGEDRGDLFDSAAQVLLAWVISHQGVMAIPKAATIAHVQQNAAVLEVELSSAELTMLDKAYPAPKGKTALDMV